MQLHFYLCALLIGTWVSGEKDLKDYLQTRLDFVNGQLAATQGTTPSGVVKDFDFHAESSELLATNFQQLQVLSKGQLLLDQTVFSINPNGDLDLNYNLSEDIAFLKLFDQNGLRLTFAALRRDKFKIYMGNNTLIQTVTYPNQITDAAFFQKKGNTYLLVTSKNHNTNSPITLYKWAGAYFDVIQELWVKGGIALEHFPGSLSTEIIVLLRDLDTGMASSYVYEFQDEKLHRIQTLSPSKARQAFAFQSQSQQFLMIFEERANNSVYLWKEDEFVRYDQFENVPGFRKAVNGSSKGYPLMFVINQESVYVYAIGESMELLNKRNIPNIVDLSLNGDSLLIFARNHEYALEKITLPFDLRLSEIVSQVAEMDELSVCITQLGKAIDANDSELESENATETEEVRSAQFVGVTNLRTAELDQIERGIENLESKLNGLEPRISNLLHDDMVVEGKLIIQGNLLVRNVEANNIICKRLNGVPWTPEQWLSYSKDQGIAGDVKIGELRVRDAQVNHPDSIFNDMLLLRGNQKLKGGKLRNLKANSAAVDEINGIRMGDVYLRSHPVLIKGNKTFPELHVDELKTEMINKGNVSDVIKLFGDPRAVNYEFAGELTIDDLIVDKVDSVDWREFERSAFRIGRDQTIRGNLTIASVKTHELNAKRLAGIEINNLFTVNAPQTVHSTLRFRNVEAKKVITQTVNGFNLQEDVAAFGDTTITGPITIKNIGISKFLHLNQSIDKSSNFYLENPIIGTNKKDLLQIYNGKVTIVGDVFVRDLSLETAKLLVAGNEFNQNHFKQFWLKNTTQEILIHFEAMRGITAPHLNIDFLNTIPIGNYMINDFNEKSATDYEFENATVLGNIIIAEEFENSPDLIALQDQAVKLEGTYNIQGVKKITGKIQVDDLAADQINDLNVANIPSVLSPVIIGTKIFEDIVVSGDVHCKNLLTNKINGASMDEHFGNVLFIDNTTVMESLNFSNVTAENLYTTKINKKLFNEYVVQVNQIYVMDTLLRVRVKGNCSIDNVQRVAEINSINVMEKFEKNRKSDVIKGNLTFDGRIHVKNLYLFNVNGINFKDLLPRLYYRHWPQNVTARHSFGVVTTQNIITPRINDIYLSSLVDVSSLEPQTLRAPHGLQITSPAFRKSLFADFGLCDFNRAIWSLANIPTRFWNSVQIDGETIIVEEDSKIMNLLNNAVLKSRANTIRAAVHFNHISAENLNTKKPINGVDLNEIFEDAIFTNTPDQVITGHKEFISLKSAGATVFGNARIPIVNSMEIAKINANILRDFDAPVRGRKTFFGGLQAKHLYSKTVCDVIPDNLVTLTDLRPVPNVSFDSLEVINDLNVDYVNYLNFTEFLEGRLLINSEADQVVSALYFLEELQLDAPIATPSINDIMMQDVVFDEGTQAITSQKKLMTNLFLNSDARVEEVNGFELDNMYRLSVKLSEPAEISGNVRFDGFSEINGNVAAQSINGVPLDVLREMLETQNPQIRTDIVRDTVTNIQRVVDENIEIIKRLPDQYLYLEMSDKLQIDLANAVDAQPVNNGGSVMMHIKSEEPGSKCGLPEACLCSGQHTIQISPGYSMNVIENKYGQRVFSYRNEVIFVHVITNSVSTSEDCRTNGSTLHEYTTLTWTVAPVGSNTSGSSHIHQDLITGYISDAKFFTFEGYVYLVLSRFYDALLNSHDLYCEILRFSKGMDKIEDVQRIPTRAAWTLHVFYSAQGINLIIGNKDYTDYSNADLSTGIYRFHPVKKLFYLLRTIPIAGCTSAASVVLGYDSLIILAHQKTPLQIWKYYPSFDNYYLYQSLVFDHPVSSVSTFYTGGAGISDAYLTAVTDNNHFYVYSYQYLAGWKLESEGEMDGLKALVPFRLNHDQFLFAPSLTKSSLLTIVKHGP